MNSLLTLILSCVIFQATSAQSDCRKSWLKFEESCYLFALESATWAEAEAICFSMNGRLVEIETQSESDFIEKTLRNMFVNDTTDAQKSEHSFWLGGNDVETEGIFKWVKSDVYLTYTDWNAGQPDDASLNEDCMEVRGAFQYHWNDLLCTMRQQFICEQQLGLPIDETLIG